MRRPYTLIINRFDSKCGHCGLGAYPNEQTHRTIAGYAPGHGCGVRWVFVASDYTNINPTHTRPDLTWEQL